MNVNERILQFLDDNLCKGYMEKIKLFRKGRYVGMVNEDFHRIERVQEKTTVWDNLGISSI